MYRRVTESERTRGHLDTLSWSLFLSRTLSLQLFYISLTCFHPGDHSSVIRVTPISVQLKVISGTNERVSIICTWAKRRVHQALPYAKRQKTAEERNTEKGSFLWSVQGHSMWHNLQKSNLESVKSCHFVLLIASFIKWKLITSRFVLFSHHVIMVSSQREMEK